MQVMIICFHAIDYLIIISYLQLFLYIITHIYINLCIRVCVCVLCIQIKRNSKVK